ncbi:MAG: TetR/AcrR family transcriptional regulator [Pseudomonadota bacterium]|nr:TetR/AcrR family transcriptional regulator [Pseudomonadota bacterium]
MDTRNSTRDEIIRVGLQILGEKGFNSCGIDAVLKTAKIPKGSFYYYFPSKEEFGLAVLDLYAQNAQAHAESYLQDKTLTPLARLRRYLKDVATSIEEEGCTRGCFLGNMTQEMAGQNDRFRVRLNEIWDGWKRIIAESLREAKAAKELKRDSNVDLLAEFIIIGLEGGMLRSKVSKTALPMKDMADILFERVLL